MRARREPGDAHASRHVSGIPETCPWVRWSRACDRCPPTEVNWRLNWRLTGAQLVHISKASENIGSRAVYPGKPSAGCDQCRSMGVTSSALAVPLSVQCLPTCVAASLGISPRWDEGSAADRASLFNVSHLAPFTVTLVGGDFQTDKRADALTVVQRLSPMLSTVIEMNAHRSAAAFTAKALDVPDAMLLPRMPDSKV